MAPGLELEAQKRSNDKVGDKLKNNMDKSKSKKKNNNNNEKNKKTTTNTTFTKLEKLIYQYQTKLKLL